MKIVINEDDYGRVVRTPGAFDVYFVEVCGPKRCYWFQGPLQHWSHKDTFVLNRENALRLQEDIRIWLKEHPE